MAVPPRAIYIRHFCAQFSFDCCLEAVRWKHLNPGVPSSSPGLWGQLISDEIPKSTAPALLPEVTLTPYSFGIFPPLSTLLLNVTRDPAATTAVQQHPNTVADTQQPTTQGNPKQQKHPGQQYSLGGCFGFSSSIYKTIYISHRPKSFSNIKPFSAHFPPDCKKLHLCFISVCWFIQRRCSGYHFSSAFGTTFHKPLSHVTGHFWEFDQQQWQRYKTQRKADKSTMRFSVVRFDTI